MAETLASRRRPEAGAQRAPALVTHQGPKLVAVEIGGTEIRVAHVRDGHIVGVPLKEKTPSRYAEAKGLIRDLSAVVLDGRRPDATGVSIAGEVSRDGSTIESAGQLQEMGYTGQPIAEDVAEATRVRDGRNVIMLNDCGTGVMAELQERRREMGVGSSDPVEEDGMFATLSTGAGAGLRTREGWIVPDPAGHRFLKPGAICGDGQEGHAEAHISGSGQFRKFGRRSELIPEYVAGTTELTPEWQEIKGDFHDWVDMTLGVYQDAGLDVGRIAWTGSVALKGPHMLSDLQQHLNDRASRGQGPSVRITEAVHGEESGLVGAGQAAELTHAGNRPFVVYYGDGIKAVKGLRASR